jgi:hypothetical protein
VKISMCGNPSCPRNACGVAKRIDREQSTDQVGRVN